MQVAALKVDGLVHVLQEATGRADQNVHAIDAFLLKLDILAANHQSGAEIVIAANLAQHAKDLQRLKQTNE